MAALLADRAFEAQFQFTRLDASPVRILPRSTALGAGGEARVGAVARRPGCSGPGHRVLAGPRIEPEVVVVKQHGKIRTAGRGIGGISAERGAGLASIHLGCRLTARQGGPV